MLPVKERAKGLEKVATADHTQQLPPGTAIGMAIGAEIPPAHPVPIGTVGVRAEMVPGVHLALAATGGGDPWRWRSRGSDRRGWRCLRIRDTLVFVGETGKHLRL